MKLTELFAGNKQIDNSGKTQQKSAPNTALVNRQIHALKPGQTLQGEVIARNGSEVQIKVAEDFVIKARVEQNVNLDIGKNMTFEIKNNGQTLTLLPLYTNTATDANVLKALDMASLPVNADTISMTEQMMQAGLSIDRSSLQQVFRESNLYPESNPADIIDLHKLSMPVNETNLTQIASYKNLTHQLNSGLNEVINALPDSIQNMLQKGDVDGAAKLFKEILNLFSGKEAAGDTTPDNTMVLTDGSINPQSGNVTTNVAAAPLQADLQLLLDMLAAKHGTESSQGAEGMLPNMLSETAVLTEGQVQNLQGTVLDGMLLQNLQDVTSETVQPKNADVVTDTVMQMQNPEGTAITEEISQNQVAQTQHIQNQVTQQPLELLQRLLQQGIQKNDKAFLQSLLSNKEIVAFVKDNLQNLWSIRPQDVADEGSVEKLYQRLDKQLKGLTQALENANQTGSEVYKATANLTQNLDFLQQLNQTYTYLQLPLRLQQGNNAHGDLYVYTNKKHLASKDGKVTALLHLDMEHLGPVDVYVAMQQEKVSTKFYVQDNMLDFLEDHMNILTERLKKRGYDCSIEMLAKEHGSEEKENVVQKLLEKEPQVPIVQYAFDVRT